MADPLTWTVFKKYVELHQNRIKLPIQWDTKKRRLNEVKRQSGDLNMWYLRMSTLAFMVCCCGFLMARQLFSKTNLIPMWITIIQIGMGFVGLLIVIFGAGIALFAKDLVMGFNCMLEMVNQDAADCEVPSGGFKLQALLLIQILYQLKLVPFIIAPFGMLTGMDPYPYIYCELMPQSLQSRLVIKLLFFVIRVLLNWVTISEIVRIFAFVLPFLVIFLTILNNLIVQTSQRKNSKKNYFNTQKVIFKMSESFSSRRTFVRLNRLQIFLNVLSEILESLLFVTMTAGMMLSVLFNFVSVKLYDVIPMPIYLVFPSVALVLPFLIASITKPAFRVYKVSSRIVWDLKGTAVNPLNRRHFRMKLDSLKILTLHAGLNAHRLYSLTTSTKSKFYVAIMNYSITAFLSVPDHKLV